MTMHCQLCILFSLLVVYLSLLSLENSGEDVLQVSQLTASLYIDHFVFKFCFCNAATASVCKAYTVLDKMAFFCTWKGLTLTLTMIYNNETVAAGGLAEPFQYFTNDKLRNDSIA